MRPILSTLLLLLPTLLAAQNGKDRILREYFPENEARDQAVICARYAEAAHRYTYRLLEPPFPEGSSEKEEKRHIDTARAFILHARRRVDSTLHHAADSSEQAIELMRNADRLLKEGDVFLKLYQERSDEGERRIVRKNALNRSAEASVDAFHASMLLGTEDPENAPLALKEGTEERKGKMERDEDLYELMGGMEERKKEMSGPEKEAGRLELDRQSFRSLRDRYKKEIDGKTERIAELKKQKAPEERIDSLKEEKELLELKKEDAEEQVANINGILQERLFEKIGLDSAERNEGTVFQVDRHGYYEDNPVPIDKEQKDGLIYRVQVGYYSKENRPEEKFEGLYPLWGEEVSDQYVRYCVGRFRDYSEADRAKDYLNEEGGFPDAFIVAYKDGEKIPVVEAIKENEEE